MQSKPGALFFIGILKKIGQESDSYEGYRLFPWRTYSVQCQERALGGPPLRFLLGVGYVSMPAACIDELRIKETASLKDFNLELLDV